jgi:hypothetical protein
MAEPDFIAVVSGERTAGTAVANSLRIAYPGAEALHVHYVDRSWDHLEGIADPDERVLQAAKREREDRVRLRLADPGLSRVIFTVLRSAPDRLTSAMWYLRAQTFAAMYDPSSQSFDPAATPLVRKLLRTKLSASARYENEVYPPLGVSARPGLHIDASGPRVAVLRFEHLEEDFRNATTAIFGYPVELLHINAAKQAGPPGCYRAFRAFARPLILSGGFPDRYDGFADPPGWDAPQTDLARLKSRALEAELEDDWRAQVDAWAEVLEIAPHDVQAHQQTARLWTSQGRHSLAAEHVRILAEAQPQVSRTWVRLADACRAAGDLRGELDAWRRLRSLDGPTEKGLSRLLTLLEQLGEAEEAARTKAELKRLKADQA